MRGKTTPLKPPINKYKADLPQQYKMRACLSVCFYCLFAACFSLSLACNGSPETSLPKNSEPVSLKNNETTLSAKDYQNNSHCDALANRIDELETLILRQEQAAKQALLQAKESCQGDSAVDCGFWTERANSLARQIRELRQQQQTLTTRKSQQGCL
jgi:hypothetical protein